MVVKKNMKETLHADHADHANERSHTKAYTVASNHSRYSLVIQSCDVHLRKQEGDHRRSDMQDNRGTTT